MVLQKTIPNILTIKADLDLLDTARSGFSHFLNRYPLPIEDIRQWELVFTEAVANAIKHGGPAKTDNDIKITWAQSPHAIRLSVSDRGPGPSPKCYENPQLPQDPLSTSGRGMYIIASFADQWIHQKSPLGYTQVIVKNYFFELVTVDAFQA